jgi:beta-N-acetylhexosaminidase
MIPSRLLMIDLSATELTGAERDLLASRAFGGVCLFGRNVSDRYQLADYVSEVRALAGPDFIVAIDQEGGGVLRVPDVPYAPAAMALGAAGDLQLTHDVAAATARGLRAVGVNVNFAPVADVNVNPLNPVIADRSFGSDPAAVAAHVSAFTEGLQSEGVAATVKHFPGHGDTSEDSHLALPVLQRSLAELEELELPPFRAAVEAGAAAVMSAHIVFPALDPQLPATLSPLLLQQLLRTELGFRGVVFSDALNMKAITANYEPVAANLLALQAGVDMPVNIGPAASHLELAAGLALALQEGRLDPELVRRSLARLEALTARFPGRVPDADQAWRDGDGELLARAAHSGLVSLGELPVLAAGESVLLVAPAAVWTSAASQEQVGPGEEFARELERRGIQVRRVMYDAAQLAEPAAAAAVLAEVERARAQLPGRPLLFVTSKRTPLSAAELHFSRAVAQSASGSFLHVALWNPYHARLLPEPALLSFGFRPAALQAAAAALLGQAPTGTLPA